MTVDELKKAMTTIHGKLETPYAEQLVEYFKIISKDAEEAVKPIKLPKKLKKKALANIGKHNQEMLKKVAEAEYYNNVVKNKFDAKSVKEAKDSVSQLSLYGLLKEEYPLKKLKIKKAKKKDVNWVLEKFKEFKDSYGSTSSAPPEYLVDGQMKPMQQKDGINYVSSTCYVTEQWQQGTPSGSAGTTDFGGWGVSSTNSPVSEWKKAAAKVLKQELLMDPTVIALQTRVKELEQKLAKKELQESSLKEPKKRKRIVEI